MGGPTQVHRVNEGVNDRKVSDFECGGYYGGSQGATLQRYQKITIQPQNPKEFQRTLAMHSSLFSARPGSRPPKKSCDRSELPDLGSKIEGNAP